MTLWAPNPPRQLVWLIGRLLVLFVLQVLVFLQVWRFFVTTEHGQWLDTVALTGNYIGSVRVGGVVNTVLNAVSVVSVLAATAVVGFIALARRRIALGVVAILLVGGAALTAQLLKGAILRPDLGVDPDRASAGNSFPSGHSTVAASVAVALVLVLPPRARGLAAVIGATYTALVGVATMSAGWHRPSDSVAAFLVVGGWAAVAGLALIALQYQTRQGVSSEPNRMAVAFLTVVSVMFLIVAVVAILVTDQVSVLSPDEILDNRLMVAYGGSAAGIAGAAGLMMAAVLATVHRLVPPRSASAATGPEPALVAAVPPGWRVSTAWIVPAAGSARPGSAVPGSVPPGR
jgi:membrane-associated phospholipid phosphatase